MRRRLLFATALLAAALAGWGVIRVVKAEARTIEVWKAQTCGCCVEWMAYMEQHGYRTIGHFVEDVDPIKDQFGVPEAVRSCHTARIAGYLIEGHVPAEAVDRLLATRPSGIAGLAVPDMPSGAPGMAEDGAPFTVVSFGADGIKPFE